MNTPLNPEEQYRRANEQKEQGAKWARRRSVRGWRRILVTLGLATALFASCGGGSSWTGGHTGCWYWQYTSQGACS